MKKLILSFLIFILVDFYTLAHANAGVIAGVIDVVGNNSSVSSSPEATTPFYGADGYVKCTGPQMTHCRVDVGGKWEVKYVNMSWDEYITHETRLKKGEFKRLGITYNDGNVIVYFKVL